MRTTSTFLAVLAAGLASVPAFAAGGGTPPAQVLTPEQIKSMSFEAMLAAGEAAVKEMNGLVKEVLDGLQEAQSAKDFQRMKCISESLTTIKGLMRLSEQNALTLRERVIARDRAGAEHEFVKVSIARNKVVELHAQSKGCGGPAGETFFEGAPRVERTFDKDLPVEDARDSLERVVVVMDPPPSASPYY